MSLVRMTWRDTLFAHWPVDPAVVEHRLPPRLDVDTYDGRAWLSVVGFRMEGIRPRGVPASLGVSFGELNLRTYVTHEGTPGIYFFNLDAGDRLGVAVARRAFGLPYYAASMRIRDVGARDDGGGEGSNDGPRDGPRVRFRSRRTHRDAPPLAFDGEYGPTDGSLADPDRAAFLTERYRFYTAGVDAATDGVA
ncbi:YqjF family protein, partial [Halomarina rubra]